MRARGICPAFRLGSVTLGGFFVPVGFAEVSVVSVGVKFAGHGESERCSLVGFFFGSFDCCGCSEQLQRRGHALVEGVGFDPDVDVGDD